MYLKVIASLILCQFYFISIQAQFRPDTLLFSHEIEALVVDGSLMPSSASRLYAQIGDYHASMKYSDIPISWGVDSLAYNDLTFEPALPHIIQEARRHQIVIISESHSKPQHRIFASKVVEGLSDLGFHYLGLETFTPDPRNEFGLADSELKERAYALNSPLTGTYTLEPQMASLVRGALKVGYQPFGYERYERIKGKDREEIQADNIINMLRKHPEAKFVILCGWHHAIESGLLKRGDVKFMAHYLKSKTGIDPLTIYQDNFTEKVRFDRHPLLSNTILQGPSIAFMKDGAVKKWTPHVDLEVIHPQTRYQAGRPSWLMRSEDHVIYNIPLKQITIDFPLFAKAYIPGELGTGVPVDIIEIKSKYDKRNLILKKGEYVLRLDNKTSSADIPIKLQ